jgi:hypothetical protein
MSNTVLTMGAVAEETRLAFHTGARPSAVGSYWSRGLRVYLVDDSLDPPVADLIETPDDVFVCLGRSIPADYRDAFTVALIARWARGFDARHGLTAAGAR